MTTARARYFVPGSAARPLTVVQRTATVANGATSTVLVDQDITANTQPVLMAIASNGAAIQGTFRVTARAKGELTLSHSAPTGAADFLLLLFG